MHVLKGEVVSAHVHRSYSPNAQLRYAREDAGDEALVLAAVRRAYGFLSIVPVDAGRRGFLHRHESSVVAQRATVLVLFILELCDLRARVSCKVMALAQRREIRSQRATIDTQLIQNYDIILPICLEMSDMLLCWISLSTAYTCISSLGDVEGDCGLNSTASIEYV
jgi:hypothetical protein